MPDLTTSASRKTSVVFWQAFFLSALAYAVFLHFRGFGWDGDSLFSAAQFVKLLNPTLYGANDLGTHPKLLCIVLFGIFYRLFGDFVLLTYCAIAINALMVALLCKWVEETGGLWWIACAGIMINMEWGLIVINCDNPAFSIPFLFMGLYLFFHRENKVAGACLMVLSSLFRPGAEIVLMFLLCLELIRPSRDRRLCLTLCGLLTVALVHTLFGPYLVYPTKKQFLDLCVTHYAAAREEALIYRHSARAVLPYIQSVWGQVTEMPTLLFLVLGISGMVSAIKRRSSSVYVGLAPMASLLLPAGTFVYGTLINTLPEKHMEYVLALPVLASFSGAFTAVNTWRSHRFGAWLASLVGAAVLLFCGLKGKEMYGWYEVNGDGTGHIAEILNGGESGHVPWKQRPLVKSVIERELPRHRAYSALVSQDNLLFFFLDEGLDARKVDLWDDVIPSPNVDPGYDLLLLPTAAAHALGDAAFAGYAAFDVGDGQWLFIRKGASRGA